MTRNWFASALKLRHSVRTGTTRPRRRNAGLALESLEARLSLSSISTTPRSWDLNPQPLPPGIKTGPLDLNPQPLPPGAKPAPLDLNPQPLPPGVVIKYEPVTPDIVGNHFGTNVAPDTGGQYYARQD